MIQKEVVHIGLGFVDDYSLGRNLVREKKGEIKTFSYNITFLKRAANMNYESV